MFSHHADGGSRNSSAYLLGRPMRSILSRNEPRQPGRIEGWCANDFSEVAFTS